jgi:hypothetical protein
MDELLVAGSALVKVAAFPERIGKTSGSLAGVRIRALMLPGHVTVTFTFDDTTVHLLAVLDSRTS